MSQIVLIDAHDPPYPQEMVEARAKIVQACLDAGYVFFEGLPEGSVIDKIEEGVRIIGSGPNGEETARIGREHTKRTMPV